MATTLLNFLTGSENNVNSVAKKQGQVIFAINSDKKTGSIYQDISNTERINIGKNAETAEKDSGGNIITSTYETKIDAQNKLDAILENLKNKSNIDHNHAASDITSGTISTERLPVASGTQSGITIVYPAASCTTFSSDSGTVTPLAVQKGAKMFAITRPSSSTNKAITRYSNTTGDVQDSKIIIEDVTNTRDSSKKAQVISIPAEGNKKMVYGYCTDQVDGTSFIGGVFDANATSYPYNQGLAIGGTSGNLLWKGVKVATSDDLASKQATITGAATTITSSDLTASRALVSNSSGKIAVSAVTSTELGYLDGVTSNIQTQLNGKASKSTATTSTAGLMSIEDKTKLDGIATGAQVNSITGVKGNAESDYRTGNINLTSANIGALALTGGTVTGATTFGSTLTVNGVTTFSSTTASSSTTTGAVKISGGLGVAGNIYAGKVYNAVWNDYAELFPRGGETEPGDIIALDETAEEEKYIKAIKGHRALVGVHSDEYGHLIGGENCSIEENLQKYIPVGLAGRVWVKIHDEPSLGDYITASDTPGVGEVTTIRDNAIGIVVSKKENGKVKIKII